MKKDKITNDDLYNALQKYFPKGHKERGKALVLFAIAQIRINELEDQVRKKKEGV